MRVRATGLNPGEIPVREGDFHERAPAAFPSGQMTLAPGRHPSAASQAAEGCETHRPAFESSSTAVRAPWVSRTLLQTPVHGRAHLCSDQDEPSDRPLPTTRPGGRSCRSDPPASAPAWQRKRRPRCDRLPLRTTSQFVASPTFLAQRSSSAAHPCCKEGDDQTRAAGAGGEQFASTDARHQRRCASGVRGSGGPSQLARRR